MNIFSLLPILGGKHLDSHHKCDVKYSFFKKMFFNKLRKFLSLPSSWRVLLIINGVGLGQILLLLHQLIGPCDFSSLALFFLNIEPALHTWDKCHLVVVYNFFIHCWI